MNINQLLAQINKFNGLDISNEDEKKYLSDEKKIILKYERLAPRGMSFDGRNWETTLYNALPKEYKDKFLQEYGTFISAWIVKLEKLAKNPKVDATPKKALVMSKWHERLLLDRKRDAQAAVVKFTPAEYTSKALWSKLRAGTEFWYTSTQGTDKALFRIKTMYDIDPSRPYQLYKLVNGKYLYADKNSIKVSDAEPVKPSMMMVNENPDSKLQKSEMQKDIDTIIKKFGLDPAAIERISPGKVKLYVTDKAEFLELYKFVSKLAANESYTRYYGSPSQGVDWKKIQPFGWTYGIL